ncbi:MAG: biotin/lipoyl-binding protein [bacterium]
MHFTEFRKSLLIIFLIVAGMAISCGEKKQEQQKTLRPVRYQQVYASGGNRVRTFSGSAQAGVESRLSFKVAGTVQRIAVQVGDRVRVGQLIAEIDPADFQLQVQKSEASLNQAKAQALQA